MYGLIVPQKHTHILRPGAVEFKSLKVVKILKVGKGWIKLENTDLIFYHTLKRGGGVKSHLHTVKKSNVSKIGPGGLPLNGQYFCSFFKNSFIKRNFIYPTDNNDTPTTQWEFANKSLIYEEKVRLTFHML